LSPSPYLKSGGVFLQSSAFFSLKPVKSCVNLNSMTDSTQGLDEVDWRLLAELARNARITQTALSEAVGRSPTAIARRQVALEESGVIAGYQARLDLRRLGHGTVVHIKIALGSQRAEVLQAFEAALTRCSSVVRCELMSGSDDYLVTVLARSLDHYAEIHRTELTELPGVARMESGFVLREVIEPRLPPILVPPPPRRKRRTD
jgi:DNA-binding Lrp family transcriptional regulator